MTKRKSLAGIYQITTFLAVVLLLLILFVSAAYFFMIPAPDTPAQGRDILAEVAAKRRLWESMRPASFRYVVDRDCYCDPTYVEPYVALEERGRRTAAFTIEVESTGGDFISVPPDPVWIDDLFDLVERSVREGQSVAVEYDDEFGFPVSIVVQPEPAPPDSRFRVEVRDFEILEYR